MTPKTIKSLAFIIMLVFGILAALCMKDLVLASASWQDLALITAILSTLCLIIFPRSLAMFFNKAGAIAVNLIIYYSILFNGHWPSVMFED